MRKLIAGLRGRWFHRIGLTGGLVACMAVAMHVIATPSVDAQAESPVNAVAETAPRTRTDAIRREIARQKEEHAQRMTALDALRDSLRSAEAPKEQIEAIDRLAADEQRDYSERLQSLERWLRILRERPARETHPGSPLFGELNDIARVIGSLNQSYAIAPTIGPGAATGGSIYIDHLDPGDAVGASGWGEDRDALKDGPRDEYGEAEPGEGMIRPAPPVVWCPFPAWLFGEVPPPRIPVQPERCVELQDSIRSLTKEVEQLRREIETLKKDRR